MDNLETQLKRGDIVEVVTNKNAKPSAKWLEHVKTSFAKRQIHKAVEKAEKLQAKIDYK
jgi:GTP pyrophosphokinase